MTTRRDLLARNDGSCFTMMNKGGLSFLHSISQVLREFILPVRIIFFLIHLCVEGLL